MGKGLILPLIEFKDEAEAARELADLQTRWDYTLGRLSGLKYSESYGWRRTAKCAADFWGTRPKYMRRFLREPSALREMFIRDKAERSPVDVAPFCGMVYLARVVSFPHIIKVGFTRNAVQRQKALSYAAGAAVKIEQLVVGTLFDEAINLLVRANDGLSGEWAFDRDYPFTGMPRRLAGLWPVEEWAAAHGATGPGCALSKIYLAHVSGAHNQKIGA